MLLFLLNLILPSGAIVTPWNSWIRNWRIYIAPTIFRYASVQWITRMHGKFDAPRKLAVGTERNIIHIQISPPRWMCAEIETREFSSWGISQIIFLNWIGSIRHRLCLWIRIRVLLFEVPSFRNKIRNVAVCSFLPWYHSQYVHSYIFHA